jgi:hypothetical protein
MRMCLIAGIIILILVIVVPAGKLLFRIRAGNRKLCKSANVSITSCCYSSLIADTPLSSVSPNGLHHDSATKLGSSYDYDRTMTG